jgi:polyphenol oxidase
VGEDVSAPVRTAFGAGFYNDGHLDLPAAVEQALRDAGCVRVDHLGDCTSCHPDRYFSHRRDQGPTGRQGAIAYVA